MVVLVCFGAFIWQCGDNNPVSSSLIGLRMDDRGATSVGIAAVVQANNQFALDVYDQLKQQETGNIFLSPYSMSMALAMVYEGARGSTAEEMANVFYFPKDDDVRRPAIAALYNALNEEDAEHELGVANALWAQKDYTFLESYVHTLQNYYAAHASNLDFIGATEDARNTINTWVESHTNDKIEDLFPEGSLNHLTRLVLTNAVYFKGEWATQFDKAQTRDDAFYVTPDNTVNVSMMRLFGDDAEFKYIRDDGVQVLEMAYKGDEISMVIFLPAEGQLADFENTLSLEKVEQWKDKMRLQTVHVSLPKFKFETKYFMGEMLEYMGMATAFSEEADFSGMDGTTDLRLQKVIHQAFVDVNEEGTEAAAATGAVGGPDSAPPSFYANRPFLFMIQDVEHGNILFWGRVTDPTK